MKRAKGVLLYLAYLAAIFILVPALLLAGFVALVRQDSEVYRVASPDRSRYAVVIESNQGAMGGATYVEVAKPPRKLFFVCSISLRGQRVYSGHWGEAERIRVEWQDDDTLLINGVAYPVA